MNNCESVGKSPCLWLLVVPALLSLVQIGCTAGAIPATGEAGGQPQLTAEEEQAVNLVLGAAFSLTAGTAAAQGAVNDEEGEQAGFDLPLTTSREFGTCPQVSLNINALGSGGEGSLAMSVDFGNGCHPLGFEDVTFSGGASGTMSVLEQFFSIQFDDLTVADDSLTGQADLEYERGDGELSFSGSWDLTYTDGEDGFQAHTDGTGSILFSLADAVTTITTFTGHFSDDDLDGSMTMTDVLVSYSQYGSFMPFGGSVTVTGNDIRPMTITFDENSPATGQVQISIQGGPPINTNWDFEPCCD